MHTDHFNWKIGGYAGEGIMTTGLLFSKVCLRHGFNVFDYTEYPSLIRGGHNTYQVYAAKGEALTQRKKVDLLVALNKNALIFHQDELSETSLVIFDEEDDEINISDFSLKARQFNLPMVRLAKESGADKIMANNVALGASLFFLGLDFSLFVDVLAIVFADKGEAVVNLNKGAAEIGYRYAQENAQALFSLEKSDQNNRYSMTGNEAIALGAVAGGLQCYIAYPMTPSSSVLHYLAEIAPSANIVVKHAEDEIGVINMALGSAFAGARTMVGTSGGGFCYMTEALGLSGVAELPLVIFESMRPGPALGMPTWTAQADLLFLINASQDEFPRFVLTPADGQEAFALSLISQELAEKYQVPVILVSDKYLSESRYTLTFNEKEFINHRHGFFKRPDKETTALFPRYQTTDSGISPRSVPGDLRGAHVANSYAHDEYGIGTEEASVRKNQMEKRFRKFMEMKKSIPEQYYESHPDAKLTLISFGSTKGTIVSARGELIRQGIPTNHLHLSWIWPFPAEQVLAALDATPKSLVIEANYQGQLAKLISQETGKIPTFNFNRYDGRPFYLEDVVDHVKNLITKC